MIGITQPATAPHAEAALRSDARVVMTVPEAGAKLGLGRNASYAAAARGEIPTIRIGRLLRVPVAALMRMLEQAGPPARREGRGGDAR